MVFLGIEKLKRKETISVTVRPTQDFAKGDVMRTKVNGYVYSGQFRTEDVGRKGGMVATVGKLKEDIETYGKEESPTKVQRYLLQKSDVRKEKGLLVPNTKRGETELRSLKKHGDLLWMGGDVFIPESEFQRFQELKYFENPRPRGGKLPRGIKESEVREARGKGVPESIVSKMKRGMKLTNDEEEQLHRRGLVYVPGYPKPGTIGVRSFLRKYTGRTEARMRAVRKARGVWTGMTPRERSVAMPGGEI